MSTRGRCHGWALSAAHVAGLLLLAAVLLGGGPAEAQEPCADCHEEELESRWAETAHGFLDCVDCHAGAGVEDHTAEEVAADCGECHDGEAEEFAASIHGQIEQVNGVFKTGCASCHGPVHELRPRDEPASPTHPLRLAATCGACHADPRMAERMAIRRVQPLEAYQASVHARALKAGRDGADCADCHDSHAIFAAGDPRSSVFHQRVPETCGGCHEEIAGVFRGSIHGQAAALGVRDSPVCTDCHGEHRILSPQEKGSPVFASNLPKMTCGRCHGDLRLTEKFGLAAGKVEAYADSYHGLASRSGEVTVANCASCHGIHDILPSTDARSHIHDDNLAATCGRCHPGAGSVFAIGPVHVLPTEREHAAVYYIRLLYIWLIVLVVGAMVLHNLLDLWRKGRDPRRGVRRGVGPASSIRMPLGVRIAHGLVAGSFILLAYTGFALKYPETWWAAPLLAWEGGFGLRGWLHRAAAVVMLGGAGFHLLHLALTRRLRSGLLAIRPGAGDWRELKGNLAFFLGRRKAKPPAPSFGYPEKLEYLAMIWGTLLMAVTGFVLWFENLALRWGPKWITDVATAIHFYEAVLACLAIVVWHFYFVLFDPVVYPMDPAWLTGRSAPGRAAERELPELPNSAPRRA